MEDEAQYQTPLSRPAPGQLLAEAREARGWSIGEVAMRLKFSPRQLEALEADAYHALPGPAIVRGMVRNYAKALGMDSQPLIADLEHRLHSDPMTLMARDMHVPFSEPRKGTRLYLGLAIVATLAVGVFAAQRWYEERRAAAAGATTTTTTPARAPIVTSTQPPLAVEPRSETPTPGAPATSAQDTLPGNKRVEFSFDDEAWVEVTDASGRILLAQLNAAHSRTAVEGKPPFDLVVGNASAVHVIYDGNAVDIREATRNEVARLRLD
jgi:cytoskeleton protein RodZ